VVDSVLSHRASTCALVKSMIVVSLALHVFESSGSTFVSRSSAGGRLARDCCGAKTGGTGGSGDAVFRSPHPTWIAIRQIKMESRRRIACSTIS
jgi:hypothetical protein